MNFIPSDSWCGRHIFHFSVTNNVFDNHGLDILATQGLHRNDTDASTEACFLDVRELLSARGLGLCASPQQRNKHIPFEKLTIIEQHLHC